MINDDEPESLVLVTCYHVMIDGIPNDHLYYNADAITDNMKSQIEEYAKRFTIKVNSKRIKLRDILVKNSSIVSSRLSVCLYTFCKYICTYVATYNFITY